MTGAAFVELYFVMSSLFASRAYYAFGFLALTAGVVGLTTATVTILFTYFVLCAEEYRCVLSSFLLFLGHYNLNLSTSSQMALASVLDWRRQRFLVARIWAVLLGFQVIARLPVQRVVVPWLPFPPCTSRFPGHRYVIMVLRTSLPLVLMCLGFSFSSPGTIGFLASYWAVRRLYSAIRID
jgi:transmembrane 9 superfamily protein 2/4